jgi:YebC/PmpR family DNA-binding regulatory protein
MSGHSKWHTIKHKKAALDSKRGRLFTRLIKEIVIAARSGGDVDMNPRLRTAVTAAKAVSMPADNIKRAIMRGTGELEGGQIDEITFEGYGPGGAAIIVNTATDNRNRTVADIRHAFSKHGGNMGQENSVAWMFDRRSQIILDKENTPGEDDLMAIVLDAGADDLRDQGDSWEVLSDPAQHDKVVEAIQKAGVSTVEAKHSAMIPKNLVKVDSVNAKALLKLVEVLDDHDDVQDTFSNFELDEADMEALAG